ncbi:response regulator [Chachezhania antarctica]|uniref:response regulator n=1 Tax=Chachezhania antarctica TaxID=2340860 RepID=UPI000EAE9F5E|nr:response regulator [Chachezhania antarctica]|tara:strand:+ start:2724 stop:3110 length:387 start_codon:yes stop_codon:yes gene_type:complete
MSIKDSLRILVVDDMAISRSLITQALDEIGIRHYRTENDGARAFQSLATQPVHLVISDLNMPGMDGLQLLEAIRTHKETARTGFVLVTGRADAKTLGRGQKLAMNNYLQKPFDTPKMKKCIETVVGRL